MLQESHVPARRVLVGIDQKGSSAVIEDVSSPETILANGIILQEVWQQRSLPAELNDEPLSSWLLGPEAPTVGAVVRILTVPGANDGHDSLPDLHSDPSLHVITMLDGELDFVLESGTVTLTSGESIVLRDSFHDLRNNHTAVARFVYTSFPLVGGPSSG